MRMGDRSSKLAGLGIICVLAVSLPDSASDKRPSSMASDERAIRSLISNWVEAYEDLDAKGLAALETPEVQVVDRFGVLHLVSGRSENGAQCLDGRRSQCAGEEAVSVSRWANRRMLSKSHGIWETKCS